MQTERLPYLDYARVFAAYLVIFGHLLPEDNHIPRYYIYAFHMPFFFLVSGMLHKLNGTIQWKKYLRTIGIPLLFFNLFYFFFVNPFYFRYIYIGELVVGNYFEALISGFPRLWYGILGEGNLPSGVTWFLLVLLWCKLMMDIIHNHKKTGWILFVFLFVLTIGLHVKFLWIRNAMMAFPFYYIGNRYRKKIEQIVFKPKALLYAGICFFLLVALVSYNGRVSVSAVSFGSKEVPFLIRFSLFYINSFIGSMMMLFVSTCFKSNRIITYLATSLITILGMQAIFNDPYRLLCPPDNYLITLPLAILILFVCASIHWLIMKYIPFVLGKTNANK